MFIRFVKLCAGRIGQILNVSSLANECDINVATVQSWLSILETSYVLFLVKPYHKNYNKRLVKTPKLYFYDTGLAASLLGIQNTDQVITHYMRGELFENFIICEYIKKEYSQGKEPSIYFWRDSNGYEVDLLIEKGQELSAIEIKSGSTYNADYFKGLKHLQKLSGISSDFLNVIHGGDITINTSNGTFLSWKEAFEK